MLEQDATWKIDTNEEAKGIKGNYYYVYSYVVYKKTYKKPSWYDKGGWWWKPVGGSETISHAKEVLRELKILPIYE